MQIAEIGRNTEYRLVLIVLGKNNTEVVITHIGREVVPDDTFNALTGFLVDNGCLEDFNQREFIASNPQRDGNDVQLDRIAITLGVIPMRQGIEPVVDHPQGVAEVLTTTIASGQIGKIGGDARVFRRKIILVKRNALDSEIEVLRHILPQLSWGAWVCGHIAVQAAMRPPLRHTGTPRPWTFFRQGRSPGSRVIASVRLPGLNPSDMLDVSSPLTVAGTAPAFPHDTEHRLPS